MFEQVVELPESPSWRVAGTTLDGVIELQRVDARMVPGNDASGFLAKLLQAQDSAQPDVVGVTYAVCLYAPDGTEIARGICAYSDTDAARIMGRKSLEIETVLGFRGRDEMIHRDDLVLDT